MSDPNHFVGWQHKYSNQLRIFYVNQSYKLKDLPSFLTAIKELSAGRPSLIMHSGEMLVDSSEHVHDFGFYIIQALNVVASHVPIVATFGTSVCDGLPTRRLERVLNASTFEWVLPNDQSSSLCVDRCMPSHVKVEINNVPKLDVVGVSEKRCGQLTTDDESLVGDTLTLIPQLTKPHGNLSLDEAWVPVSPAVAVVQGNNHYVLSQQVHRLHFKTSTDYFGFTVVDVVFNEDGYLTSIANEYQYGFDFDSDPTLQALVDDAAKRHAAEMAQTVVAMIPDHVKDCHTRNLEKGESDMATFLLDIVKQEFDADIVMFSAADFQGVLVYNKGIVTEADINEEFPNEFNSLIVSSVPGSIVWKMIKRSRRAVGTEPNHRFLHTDSGLEWDAVTQTIQRVNGEPFDPARAYRVALNDLEVARGHWDLNEYFQQRKVLYGDYLDFPAAIFRTLMERLWSSIDKNQYTVDDPETLKADLQSATGIPVVTDRLVAMMWQYAPHNRTSTTTTHNEL
eukprot:gene9302-6664_t